MALHVASEYLLGLRCGPPAPHDIRAEVRFDGVVPHHHRNHRELESDALGLGVRAAAEGVPLLLSAEWGCERQQLQEEAKPLVVVAGR